jgi:REP element-mobilizing transposase RayT
MRYLITFACYGARLHGNESGSIDRHHNRFGGPVLEGRPGRASAERELMDQPPFSLDERERTHVLEAIREVCAHRTWNLLAAHVRSNHVHVVVESEQQPEKIMNALKAYSSRRLNEVGPCQKRWARHGSTRRLWKDDDVRSAVRYVIDEQGEAMAAFEAEGIL